MSLDQWLRLCAHSAGGTGSIPGWGTKILHPTCRMVQPTAKKKSSFDFVSSPLGDRITPGWNHWCREYTAGGGKGGAGGNAGQRTGLGEYLNCNLLSTCKCNKMLTTGNTRWQVYALLTILSTFYRLIFFPKPKENNSTWNFLFTTSQGSPDRCQLHSLLSGTVLMSACIGWAASCPSSSEGGLFPYLSHSLASSLHPSCPISFPDSLNILTCLLHTHPWRE